MQRVQQQHGPEKLAVVLVSVDPGYFPESDAYLTTAKKILETQKIDWPSLFMPGGWNDAVHTFNVSGYGMIVVDAEGIVRGVNLRGHHLDKLVAKLLKEKKTNSRNR